MASSASMFPAAVVVPAAGTLVRPAAQRLEGRRVPWRWEEEGGLIGLQVLSQEL